MAEGGAERRGMVLTKEERRIQREAEKRLTEKRNAAEAESRRLAAIRSQPVEQFYRKPGQNLDRLKNTRGEYYTGNEKFDEQAASFNRQRPRPEQFSDVYPKQKIIEALTKVERIKNSAEYKEARGKAAIASEYVVKSLIDRKVFGKHASAMLASDYDDFVNHADIIVTIREPGSEPMFMAIDVTTKPEHAEHRKKLEHTVRPLKHNETNKLDFYSNPELPDFKGKVPATRVVLETPESLVNELMEKFSNNEKYDPPIEVQQEFIEEAILQLSQSAAFLLTEHYRAGEPIELAGNDPEAVIDFFNSHGLQIKRQDPELYENVMMHVKQMGYYLLLEKEKGPASRDDVKGGALWKLVHEGKAY